MGFSGRKQRDDTTPPTFFGRRGTLKASVAFLLGLSCETTTLSHSHGSLLQTNDLTRVLSSIQGCHPLLRSAHLCLSAELPAKSSNPAQCPEGLGFSPLRSGSRPGWAKQKRSLFTASSSHHAVCMRFAVRSLVVLASLSLQGTFRKSLG